MLNYTLSLGMQSYDVENYGKVYAFLSYSKDVLSRVLTDEMRSSQNFLNICIRVKVT